MIQLYVVPVKSKVEISQNFVAFSEYMNFTVIISEQDCQTQKGKAMKTLAEQNITTVIDAAKALSIQSSSEADGVKIPKTKEELELVQASLVAEAELLNSIQNRPEDIRIEESSLTLLYSDERETIFDIGNPMVDNEVPNTLGTGGEVVGNPADAVPKSEPINEVLTEIDPAQRQQTSDAPFNLMLKRPVSKSETEIVIGSHLVENKAPKTLGTGGEVVANPADVALKSKTEIEVKTEINQAQQPQISDAPLDLTLKRPVSKSETKNEIKTEINQAQQPQTFDSPLDLFLKRQVSKSEIKNEVKTETNPAHQPQLFDAPLEITQKRPVSPAYSDITDEEPQSPKENSAMDNETPKTLGTGGEVAGNPADIAHKSEAKNEVKTEIDQAQRTKTSDTPLDLKLKRPVSKCRTKKTRRRGSRGPQLPGGPGQVEGPNTGPGGPSVSLEGGPLGTNRPLQNGPSNAANSLPFIMGSNNSANPGEPGQPHDNTMKEKVEKFIPLEFMITSQNSSGFPTIVGQILGHLDFDTLVSCRLVSKDFNNFLDDKTFWIACLDQVRKEYLDKLLVEGNLPKPKCSLVNIMSPKDIKKDYDTWITLIEIIKNKDSIEDLINFTKLIKQSEELITSFASFCPIKFMFAFWATGHPRWVPGFKNLPFKQIKLFKKFVNLEMFEEEDLIEMQWNIMIEMVCRSSNPDVVDFFTSKLMKVDSIRARDDIKHFEEEMKRWMEENRQFFERRKNNFISPLTLYYGIACAVAFTSYHIPGIIKRFF